MSAPAQSEAVTEGVRVVARPYFLPEQSDPDHENPRMRRFAFAYRITITNEGQSPATLRARRWAIVDATGDQNDVEGEGVVGEQPRLEPGDRFEYSSWCNVPTSWGTMEGAYIMERDDGSAFEARVARFYLVAEPAPAPLNPA